MKIAMVLSNDNDVIVPIVEGPTIRIYDTETDEIQDFGNPAIKLQSGKRGAVIKWLNEKGVNILCSPPKMLCELSYEAAQKEHFLYCRIQDGTRFADLKSDLLNNQLEITRELPENEIVPSFVPQDGQ